MDKERRHRNIRHIENAHCSPLFHSASAHCACTAILNRLRHHQQLFHLPTEWRLLLSDIRSTILCKAKQNIAKYIMNRSSVLQLLAQLKAQINSLNYDLEVLEKDKKKLIERRLYLQRYQAFYNRTLETEKNVQCYIKTSRLL